MHHTRVPRLLTVISLRVPSRHWHLRERGRRAPSTTAAAQRPQAVDTSLPWPWEVEVVWELQKTTDAVGHGSTVTVFRRSNKHTHTQSRRAGCFFVFTRVFLRVHPFLSMDEQCPLCWSPSPSPPSRSPTRRSCSNKHTQSESATLNSLTDVLNLVTLVNSDGRGFIHFCGFEA